MGQKEEDNPHVSDWGDPKEFKKPIKTIEVSTTNIRLNYGIIY